MLKTRIVFRAMGSSFSPADVEVQTGLVFSKKNERGDLGTTGRYRGLPIPYGSAEFSGRAAQADLVSPNSEFFGAVQVLVRACSAAGATEMNLHVDVAFRDQCNLEMGPEFVAAVARLGVTLTMSCFESC